MEDYTYHLVEGRETILGAHMLEICPSIAGEEGKPSLEIHPLSIGGKDDPCGWSSTRRPARRSPPRSSISAGGCGWSCRRWTSIKPEHAMPKLPVARAL